MALYENKNNYILVFGTEPNMDFRNHKSMNNQANISYISRYLSNSYHSSCTHLMFGKNDILIAMFRCFSNSLMKYNNNGVIRKKPQFI